MSESSWKPMLGEYCVFKADDGEPAFSSSGKEVQEGDGLLVMALFVNGNGYEMAAVETDDFACLCLCLEWLAKP